MVQFHSPWKACGSRFTGHGRRSRSLPPLLTPSHPRPAQGRLRAGNPVAGDIAAVAQVGQAQTLVGKGRGRAGVGHAGRRDGVGAAAAGGEYANFVRTAIHIARIGSAARAFRADRGLDAPTAGLADGLCASGASAILIRAGKRRAPATGTVAGGSEWTGRGCGALAGQHAAIEAAALVLHDVGRFTKWRRK